MNNRPLKFRAWDGEEMHEATLREIAKTGFDWFKGENVMQFTGLTDKNGKEIYEGDVVKTMDGLNVVEWRVKKNKTLLAFFHPTSGEWCGVGDVEVIGNIYEDGHLLTDKGV